MAFQTTQRAVTRSVARTFSYQHVYTTTDRSFVDDGMGGGHYETTVTTHTETRVETTVEPETFMETVQVFVPDPVPAQAIAEEAARTINLAQEENRIPDDITGEQVEAAYQQAIDESIDQVIAYEGLDPDEADRSEIGNTLLTGGYAVEGADGEQIIIDAQTVDEATVDLLAGEEPFEDDVYETTESEGIVTNEENLTEETDVEEVPLTEEWQVENGDNLWSVAEQWRDENAEALAAAGIDPNATLGDIVQMMRDLNPDLERYIHAGDGLTLPSVDTFVLAREAAMIDPAFAAYNDTVTTPNGQTTAAINQIIEDPEAYLELSGRVAEASALLDQANAIRAGATDIPMQIYGQPVADAYLNDDGLLVIELPAGEEAEDLDGDGEADNRVVTLSQIERESRPLAAEEEAAFQSLTAIVDESPGDLPPIPNGQGGYFTVVSTEQSADQNVPTVTITNPAGPTGATYEISIRDLEQMYSNAGYAWPPSPAAVAEGITGESATIAGADDDTGGCLGAANDYVEGLPPEMQANTNVFFFSDNDDLDGNDAGHVLVQLPSGGFVDPMTGQPVSMDDMERFFSQTQMAALGLGLPPEVDPTAETTAPAGGSEYSYAGNVSGAQMVALIDADPADTAAWNQLIGDLGIRPDQMSLLGMMVADVDQTIVRPEFVEVMDTLRNDYGSVPFDAETAQVILSGAVVPPGAPTRAEVELLLREVAPVWSMDDWDRFVRSPSDYGYDMDRWDDVLEDHFGTDRVDAGALTWPPSDQAASSVVTAGMTNVILDTELFGLSSASNFYAARATTQLAMATGTEQALLDTVGVDRARAFVDLFPQGEESFSFNHSASGYAGEEALDQLLDAVLWSVGPHPVINELVSEIQLQVNEAGGFEFARLEETLGLAQTEIAMWSAAEIETTPYAGPTAGGIEDAQAYLQWLTESGDPMALIGLNQLVLSPAGSRGSETDNPSGDAPVGEGDWYLVPSESDGMPEWSQAAPAGPPYVLAAEDRPTVNYPTGNDVIVVDGPDGPMQLRVGDLQSAILMSSPYDFAYSSPYGIESDVVTGQPTFDPEATAPHPTGNVSLIPAVEGGPANVRVQEIAVPIPNQPGEFQLVNVVMPRENGYPEIVPGESYPGGLSALINADPSMPVEIFSWGIPDGTSPDGVGPYFNEDGWTTEMPEGFFVWDRNGDSGDLPGSTMGLPPDADAWNTDLHGRPDGADDRVMYQDPATGIIYDLGSYQDFQSMVMQGPAAYMPDSTSFTVPDSITIDGVETNTAELALGMNEELPFGGPELMRTLADNGVTLEAGVYSPEFMAIATYANLDPTELDELIHSTQELDGWLEGTDYDTTGFDYAMIYDAQANDALAAAGITPEQAVQMTPDELATAVASPVDPETGENLYLRSQTGEDVPFVLLDQDEALDGQARAWAFAGSPEQVYSEEFLDLAEEIGVDPNVLAERFAAQARLEEIQGTLPATTPDLATAGDDLVYTDELIALAASIPTNDEPGYEATVTMDPGDLANFMRYNQPPEWFRELPPAAQEAFFAGIPVDSADIPYLSPAHFGQVVDFDGDGVVSDAEIERYGSYQPYGRDYLTEMNTRSYVFQTAGARVQDIYPNDPEAQTEFLVDLGTAVQMDADNEWGLFSGHPAMVMVNMETILAIGAHFDPALIEAFSGDLNRYMSYAMMAELGELKPGDLDPTSNLDFTASTGIELPEGAPPFPAAGDQSDVLVWVDELIAMNDPVAAEAAAAVLDGMADAMEYASTLDYDQMMEDATSVFEESDNSNFFLNLVIGGPVEALYPGGWGGLGNDTLEAIGRAYVGENPITKSGLDRFQGTVAPAVAELRAAADRLRTPATEGGYLTPEGTIDPAFRETIAEEIFFGIGAHNGYFALVQPFAFAIGQHGQDVQNTISQHRAFWTQVAIFAAAAPLSGLGVAAANFAGVTSLAGRAAIQIGIGAFGTGFMLGGAEALGQQLGGGVYDWNAVGREFLGGAVSGGSLQAARLVPGFASVAFGGQVPAGAATYILNWSSNMMMGQGLYWGNVVRSGEDADFGDWLISTFAMSISGWVPATNLTNMLTPNYVAREVLEENLEELIDASVQLFSTTGPDGRTYGQMLLDGDMSVTDALSTVGRLTPWTETTLTSLLLAPIGGDVDAPIGDLNSLDSPTGYELLNSNGTVRSGSTVGLAHNPSATITDEGAGAIQAINEEIGGIQDVDASGWVPVPGTGDQVQRYFQDPNGVGYVVRVDLTTGQTLRQATSWQGEDVTPEAMVAVTAADSVVAEVEGVAGGWGPSADGAVATREITTADGTFVQTVNMETGDVTFTGVDPTTGGGWTVSGSGLSYAVDMTTGEASVTGTGTAESDAAVQALLDAGVDPTDVAPILEQPLALQGLVELAGREDATYGIDLADEIIGSGQDPAMLAVVADGVLPDGAHNPSYQLWVTVDGQLQSLGVHDGVNGGQIVELVEAAQQDGGTPNITFLHFQDGTGLPSESDHYVGLVINALFASAEGLDGVVVNHEIAYLDGAGRLEVEGYTPDPAETNLEDVARSVDAILNDPSFLLPVAGADLRAPRRFVLQRYTGPVTDAIGRQIEVDADIIAFSSPGSQELTEMYRVVGTVPGQENLVIVSDRWTGNDPVVTGYFDTDTGTYYRVDARKTNAIVATDGTGRGLVVNPESGTSFSYVSGETAVGQTEDGPITIIGPNFGSGAGETWIVELPDGSRAVFKSERGQVVADHFPTQDHFSEREVLADELSELFGFNALLGYDLVPDTQIVELSLDGSGPLTGSLSVFVESDGDIDQFWRRNGTNPAFASETSQIIAVFTYLMGETDAVDRNALLVPDPDNPGSYRPVLIDHGNAFAAIEDQYAGNYWGGRPGDPIPQEVHEQLTTLWNQPGFQDDVRARMEAAEIPQFQIDSFFERWETLVDQAVFPESSRDYRTEPEPAPSDSGEPFVEYVPNPGGVQNPEPGEQPALLPFVNAPISPDSIPVTGEGDLPGHVQAWQDYTAAGFEAFFGAPVGDIRLVGSVADFDNDEHSDVDFVIVLDQPTYTLHTGETVSVLEILEGGKFDPPGFDFFQEINAQRFPDLEEWPVGGVDKHHMYDVFFEISPELATELENQVAEQVGVDPSVVEGLAERPWIFGPIARMAADPETLPAAEALLTNDALFQYVTSSFGPNQRALFESPALLELLGTGLDPDVSEALLGNDAVITALANDPQLVEAVAPALRSADPEAASLLFSDPSTAEILGTFASRWPDAFQRVVEDAPAILAADPSATAAQAVVIADSMNNPDYQLFATVNGVLTPLGHHELVTSGTLLELRGQGFVELMHYQPNLEPSDTDLEFAALADGLLGEAAVHTILTLDRGRVAASDDFGFQAPAVDPRVLEAALDDPGFVMPVSSSSLRFPLDGYMEELERLLDANPRGYVPVQRYGLVGNLTGMLNRNPPTIAVALQNQGFDISGLTTEQLAIMEYRALEAIVIREATEIYQQYDVTQIARTHTLVADGATPEQIQDWANRGDIGSVVAHTRLVPNAEAGDRGLDLDPAVASAALAGNLWTTAMVRATRQDPARRALGHAQNALQAANHPLSASQMINAGFFNMLQVGVAVDRYLRTQPGFENDPALRAEVAKSTIGPLFAYMAALPLDQFSDIRFIGGNNETHELFMMEEGVLTLNPAYVETVTREVNGQTYIYVKPTNAPRADRTLFNTKCPALMVKFSVDGRDVSAIHLGAFGFIEVLGIYGVSDEE